jgi:hypothetical protein
MVLMNPSDPPLWHPYQGILTYYLYEKSHNFQ